MNLLKSLFLFLFTLFILQNPLAVADEENPLRITKTTLTPQIINAGQGAELKLQLELPADYHAYADQFLIEPVETSKFKVGQHRLSPTVTFYDENTKKNKIGIEGMAELSVTIEAPNDLATEKNPAHFRLTYQACTKTFCLFPATINVPVSFQIQNAPGTENITQLSFFKKPFHEILANENLFFAFLFIFITGFLTSLTPCVFPMIPITIAVLGRQAHARTHWQTILVAHSYILGIALTYSLLGIFAASTGLLFGSFMNSPIVLGFVCLVFLAMSLSMFGLYDLEPPAWLQQKLGSAQFNGYSGAFLTGVIAGVVASPCVGPVLVGILTYVAQTKNIWIGFWSLFIFAFGMGQLFLIIGLSSSATRFLPKSGAWMDGVKHFFGLMMLIGFYYYLDLLLPARAFQFALGTGFVLLGSLQGAFASNETLKTNWSRVRKGLCQALIFVGAAFLVFSILNLAGAPNWSKQTTSEAIESKSKNWKKYSKQNFEKALQDKKFIIFDFYADWCAACHELEEKTFSHPDFLSATQNWILFRFDATQDSVELQELKKKYQIVGLPTVLIFNQKGEWLKESTLTEFEEVVPFVKRLQSAKNWPP